MFGSDGELHRVVVGMFEPKILYMYRENLDIGRYKEAVDNE